MSLRDESGAGSFTSSSQGGVASVNITGQAQTGFGTYRQSGLFFVRSRSGFLLFLPPVFMSLGVRVILPLTLALFSCSPHPPPRTLGFIRPVPVLFHETAQAATRRASLSLPLSFLLFPLLCLRLSISARLGCGSGEMSTWPWTHSALPGPPTYCTYLFLEVLRLVIYRWHALRY